jgi:hypothetical protein
LSFPQCGIQISGGGGEINVRVWAVPHSGQAKSRTGTKNEEEFRRDFETPKFHLKNPLDIRRQLS